MKIGRNTNQPCDDRTDFVFTVYMLSIYWFLSLAPVLSVVNLHENIEVVDGLSIQPEEPLILEKLKVEEYGNRRAIQILRKSPPEHSVVVHFFKESVLLVVDVVGILARLCVKLTKLWMPLLSRILGDIPQALYKVLMEIVALIEATWMRIWTLVTVPFRLVNFSSLISTLSAFFITAVPPTVTPSAVNSTGSIQSKPSSWELMAVKLRNARNCDSLVASLRELEFNVDSEICSCGSDSSRMRTSLNFTLGEPLRTILVVFIAVVLALSFSLASTSFSTKGEDQGLLLDGIQIKQEPRDSL